ncbi:MAG TPA: hypothetical protein VFH94_22515 [Streptomyces sp.]|nr:hypothetical protein [Streptomyces sp.]
MHHLLFGVSAYSDPALELPAGVRRNVQALRAALTDPQAGALPAGACGELRAREAGVLLEQVAQVSAQRRVLALCGTRQAEGVGLPQ